MIEITVRTDTLTVAACAGPSLQLDANISSFNKEFNFYIVCKFSINVLLDLGSSGEQCPHDSVGGLECSHAQTGAVKPKMGRH